MPRCLTCCLFILACNFQTKAQEKFQVRLYQNSDFYSKNYFNYKTQEPRHSRVSQFDRFSIALSYKKDKLINELEIIIPEFSKSINNINYPKKYNFREGNDAEGSVSTLSVRYEIRKLLMDRSNGIKISLGIGANPYYILIKYNPTTPTTYYVVNKISGSSLNLIPHVAYSLSKKIQLDLSIPIKMYDLFYEEQRVENPTVPIRQQKTSWWVNSIFESSYTIRLGLAYSI